MQDRKYPREADKQPNQPNPKEDPGAIDRGRPPEAVTPPGNEQGSAAGNPGPVAADHG